MGQRVNQVINNYARLFQLVTTTKFYLIKWNGLLLCVLCVPNGRQQAKLPLSFMVDTVAEWQK